MFGIENYAAKIENLGDALLFGGSMVLIGMATVFAVLIIIWICLTLFKLVFHDLPEKKRKAATVAPVAPVAVQPTYSQNDEIVAVIAAAIAIAESESDGLKFRVVSFRRK